MGRIKKNRGRRDAQHPEGLHWTPLQHSCGCVTEWGWDSSTLPPPAFVEWCLSVQGSPCTWHGAETGVKVPDETTVVRFRIPHDRYMHNRKVTSKDREKLGQELTRQSLDLKRKLQEDDAAGILVDIPEKLQRSFRAKGQDPVETWLEMRLTDIFLNLGRVTLTDEMIEKLPEPRA